MQLHIMPIETVKCCWLLKIEPSAWAGSCAVCVDLQAVGDLEFFGTFQREGSIFRNHQYFAVYRHMRH